ncbi:MAG: SDR family NAD(P)-dependent oxidoreductase [Myxococcales bacterium]|nr:SDR family NAD(P)-dependent oxidoreductase [Myxococcales bacterium]
MRYNDDAAMDYYARPPETLVGKTCLITGATDGHGRALARLVAERGARLWILGRSEARCRDAQREIAEAVGEPPRVLLCDLASLAQVERAAAEFLAAGEPLHLLINNAGLVRRRREESVDGVELTLAVNYLAHFALTLRLLPRLRASAPARILNISSEGHRIGRLRLDDMPYRRRYGFLGAYNRSKLAQIYFTRELARRLEGTGVTAVAVDPGPIASGIAGDNPGLIAALARPLIRRYFPPPAVAAQSALELAVKGDIADLQGAYFHKRARKEPRLDRDPELGAKLWAWSVDKAGVDLDP